MTTTDDVTDATIVLPRWDTTPLFASLDDRAVTDAQEGLGAALERLVALYDQHGVHQQPARPPAADDIAAFDEVLAATNALDVDYEKLQAYFYAFVSTNSFDDLAQAKTSELARQDMVRKQLRARFTAWVASFGTGALAGGSELARDHAGPLRRLEVRAAHQMEPGQEALFSELTVTGATAWTRLHGDITSQLVGTVQWPDGRATTMPMAAIRNLAHSPDPSVRRAGYDAELATWPSVGVPCAAALNAVKGEANAVNARRRWDNPLAPSLYANSITAETFDAMQAAVDEALPAFRRFMRAKARLGGHSGALPWWDLFAPAPVDIDDIDFDAGAATVVDAFGTYSPALAGMARRAFDERWVDAAPRHGKVGGAFCMPFVDDRSLVLMNWTNSSEAVQILAHELGHAYHNTQLIHRTPLQRQLSMTLAETASIFCETITVNAALTAAEGDARLGLLDLDLTGATQTVVDIRSRFMFETAVYERRRGRALSVDELCELMVDAQLKTYGDGLDPAATHPWMWAVKSHYYGWSFYNWPYTFGALFGLGLYAEFRRDPDRFRQGYDELLSLVGMCDAEELGARFDIDTTDIAFWRASLDVYRDRIASYEQLCEQATN